MKTKYILLLVSKNEEKYAQNFFDSLANQTEKPDKVILFDASTDKTVDIARSYVDKVFKVDPKLGTCAYQRVLGCKYIFENYPYDSVILFVDVDAILDKNWFKEIKKQFKPGIEIVQGAVTHDSWEPENRIFSKGLKVGMRYLNHCNTAFKAYVLMAYPLDKNLPRLSDREHGYRLDKSPYTTHIAKKAKVWHVGAGYDVRRFEPKRFNNAVNTWAIAFVYCMKKYKNLHWILRPWAGLVKMLIFERKVKHFFLLSYKLTKEILKEIL